jgi:hypothetical protein
MLRKSRRSNRPLKVLKRQARTHANRGLQLGVLFAPPKVEGYSRLANPRRMAAECGNISVRRMRHDVVPSWRWLKLKLLDMVYIFLGVG